MPAEVRVSHVSRLRQSFVWDSVSCGVVRETSWEEGSSAVDSSLVLVSRCRFRNQPGFVACAVHIFVDGLREEVLKMEEPDLMTRKNSTSSIEHCAGAEYGVVFAAHAKHSREAD